MQRIQTNLTANASYNLLYSKYMTGVKHDCMWLEYDTGTLYVRYRSGKNVYRWGIDFDDNVVSIRLEPSLVDYLLWSIIMLVCCVPAAMMILWGAFVQLAFYIGVVALSVALPFYVLIVHLGGKNVERFVRECLEL